jgi:hypothetical protein
VQRHAVGLTGNAPSLNVIMGKMLRIDPDGNSSANGKDGIPASNPLVNTPGVNPELDAYGLRNPDKFSFDQATGNLLAGDVGQNQVEEVNKIVSGGNYGWVIKEGTFLCHRIGANIGPVNPVTDGLPGSRRQKARHSPPRQSCRNEFIPLFSRAKAARFRLDGGPRTTWT